MSKCRAKREKVFLRLKNRALCFFRCAVCLARMTILSVLGDIIVMRGAVVL
jgi:hypothetical protein